MKITPTIRRIATDDDFRNTVREYVEYTMRAKEAAQRLREMSHLGRMIVDRAEHYRGEVNGKMKRLAD